MSSPRWAVLLAGLLAAMPVAAHGGHDHERERLGERRPEAWAMARASAVVTPGGWSLATAAPGWSVALDVFEVPHLNQRRRTVGFDGFKEENINNSPLFGRLWLGWTLPADIGLHLGWTPPLRISGAKPRELWSLVGQRRFTFGDWHFGLAVQGGRSNVQGAFTCYDTLIGSGPGDCVERSKDSFRNHYYGLELGLSYAPGHWRLAPELTVARHDIEAETQVRARFPDFESRSLLLLSRSIETISLGVRFDLPGAFSGRLAVAHTPLKVKRRDRDGAERDALNQIRLGLEYRR